MTAAAESPAVDHVTFQTRPIRLGMRGLNLAKSIDSLDPDELTILTNALSGQGGGLSTRLGLTQLFNFGGTNVHSARRYYDPQGAGITHFWGRDTDWGRAEGGVVALLEGGFSGDPLTMIQMETEFGLSKIYVADRTKMRRAGLTSASEPIGLPKPAQPVVTVNAAKTKSICKFDASDGSQAASWKGIGLYDVKDVGRAGNPIFSDIAGPTTSAVNLATVADKATDAYSSTMEFAIVPSVDLTKFDDGSATTDDDVIHLQVRIDLPTHVAEIRLYLVCSPFTPDVPLLFSTQFPYLPGLTDKNTAAYLHVYRPGDYTDFIGNPSTTSDTAGDAIRNTLLLQIASGESQTSGTPLQFVSQLTPGADTWVEFGKIGLPVRKSAFIKVGSAGQPGTDWSTITGVYISVAMNTVVGAPLQLNANVAFDELYITGGGKVDDSEPDAQAFDYRIRHFDTATGERGNPSAVMATTVDAMRQTVNIQAAAAYGRATVRQEAFRRGATNNDNWYYVGVSTTDGGVILDNTDDTTALATGAVAIDHDQPITTEDHTGATLLAQPVPVIFGPIDGYVFALGDLYRPGYLYWCNRNEPDHWSSANTIQVCGTGDELMNGGIAGTGGYVCSRNRFYSIQVNLIDGSVNCDPTSCTEGPYGRWAICPWLGGVAFVARDAVRITHGGKSDILSDNLRPLFNGVSADGYLPIDWTLPNKLRLEAHGDELWFGYQDTAANRMWMVYSATYKTWRAVLFGVGTSMVYSDPTTVGTRTLYVGGATNGKAYTHTGVTDDGAAIAWHVRTGALFNETREEKLLGDVEVWANMGNMALTIQAFLNAEKIANNAVAIAGSAVYDRYILELFGTTPQHAQTVSIDLSGNATAAVSIQQVGVGIALQPEITMNRATAWQPLNENGEAYLTGCWIDSDTAGVARTVIVEGLLSGTLFQVATLAVTTNGGRKQWFSWAAVHADMVRLRPTGNCISWMLFGQGWLSTPEPPRIAVWDTGFEDLGDTYYTGVDIECDTFGINKTIQFYVDNVLISTQNLNANGRRLVHFTFVAARGHIYRFTATDNAVGLLYTHKWIVDKEPGEQTNWNQNYTIGGSLTDKWLKGVLLECDTFGLDKTVTIEVDGVVVASPTINTNGRKVVHTAFAQALGRVFRIYPTDANPGRLYSSGWLFDEEPYQLTRYETQEQPDGVNDWHMPVAGQIAIKSTAQVNLQVIAYGQNGLALSNQTYALPATGGVKSMISLHPLLTAQKGLLYKYLFTSAAGFWLYREESWIDIQACSGGQTTKAKVFGDDDLGPAREMRDAALTAARSGGSLQG